VIVATISVVILVVSVGGYVVESWFNGSIARIHLNLGKNRPAGAAKGSENWLLVGVDSAISGEYGDRAGERSDTVILTHLDRDGTTTNVSIPRDTLVTIPSYTDSKDQSFPSHVAKFNEAISDGGPSLLIRTVEQLTKIRVDHYVQVNLDGFKQIANAVDGVKVCILPAPASASEDNGQLTNINDGFSGFHGRYGEQVLAGDQALAFVRQRHGLPGGDIARIQRQQQFLGSVFRAATSNHFLFNPAAVLRLLSAIKGALTLDAGTSLTDLEKLGIRLRGLATDKVSFETIPQRELRSTDTDLGQVFTDGQGYLELRPTGASQSVGNVQVLDKPAFAAMIAKLKDQPPPATPKASAAPMPKTEKVTVQPSQVTVTVQNATTTRGLAGQVTAALQQVGFRTGAPANAITNSLGISTVLYAPGDRASALTVAAAVPGSTVKEDSSVSGGVVLMVGANFQAGSVSSVSTSSSVAVQPSTPAPTPTASSSAPPVTAASASNSCTY
jgi:LCP family protein required for cell wall assembly